MQILQCTANLRKEVGLKKSDLKSLISIASPLGAWHVNLIYVNRRKAVLFVNDITLFKCIVLNLKRESIKKLSNVFRENLSHILISEGFSGEVIEKVMQEYTSIEYAKTHSKSVLGSMNDFAFHYKHHIQNGEFLPDIIHKLNRMPMGALNFNYPIDLLHEILKSRFVKTKNGTSLKIPFNFPHNKEQK